LLPLLHLLLLLGLESCFDALFALEEGGFDLLGGWGGLLHPSVSHDLGQRWAVGWFNLEHARHQFLEFLGEEVVATWLVSGVRLPEDIRAVAGDALVVWVRHLGVGERWVLGD
jgi:hypothetical protein